MDSKTNHVSPAKKRSKNKLYRISIICTEIDIETIDEYMLKTLVVAEYTKKNMWRSIYFALTHVDPLPNFIGR